MVYRQQIYLTPPHWMPYFLAIAPKSFHLFGAVCVRGWIELGLLEHRLGYWTRKKSWRASGQTFQLRKQVKVCYLIFPGSFHCQTLFSWLLDTCSCCATIVLPVHLTLFWDSSFLSFLFQSTIVDWLNNYGTFKREYYAGVKILITLLIWKDI